MMYLLRHISHEFATMDFDSVTTTRYSHCSGCWFIKISKMINYHGLVHSMRSFAAKWLCYIDCTESIRVVAMLLEHIICHWSRALDRFSGENWHHKHAYLSCVCVCVRHLMVIRSQDHLGANQCVKLFIAAHSRTRRSPQKLKLEKTAQLFRWSRSVSHMRHMSHMTMSNFRNEIVWKR